MRNQESVAVFTERLQHRFAKGFLDILILQLIEAQPTWGYMIIKKTEEAHKIKLRHGALYPMLKTLEANGFLQHRKQLRKGRIRKVYKITSKGKQLLNAYRDFLKEQTTT